MESRTAISVDRLPETAAASSKSEDFAVLKSIFSRESNALAILAFSAASAFAESIILVSRVEYLGESARSGFSMPNFSTASNFDVGESSCSMEAIKESAAVSLWFCFQEV